MLLHEQSDTLIGIDTDRRALAALQGGQWDVRYMNAEAIALSMQFDCVVAGELIEHLSNPGLFLSSVSSCLRPGGRLILTTPNIASVLLYFLVVLCEKPQDPTHVYLFDRPHLFNLLSRQTDLRVSGLHYVPPTVKALGSGLMRPLFWCATVLANAGFHIWKRGFASYVVVVLEKAGGQTDGQANNSVDHYVSPAADGG